MKTLLISGVETVVGANIAATLVERYRVIGLVNPPRQADFSIGHCEIGDSSIATPREHCSGNRVDWVIHCGPAAVSSWDDSTPRHAGPMSEAVAWAEAARAQDAAFTMISSDGVFTGPWMFHEEDCPSVCESDHANAIRQLELDVLVARPGACLVRTNAYGWSPDGDGWLEGLVESLECGRAGSLDTSRHATPILASDLADALEVAFRKALKGIFHIAGTERVNPAQFARRLAMELGLPTAAAPVTERITERGGGFGRGETTLLCGKIRRAAGIALPMLADGLQRLRGQQVNGYRERFESERREARPFAA